ncbi:hypothetical protein DPEC_G00169880 [Dallia pectoralis]|uniref:Uncharacterized protein n=1 Tax=Dallia pectoralis TaxID=75939 RepID=A0ACC2GD85_DALPE|nr:hypothetical protein DPEC_G00169880 [Dallia pectoralis]
MASRSCRLLRGHCCDAVRAYLPYSSPVVIMVCVGLAVLMLGLILLLMYKWGKHRNSSHPVNHPVSSAEDSTYYNLTRGTN